MDTTHLRNAYDAFLAAADDAGNRDTSDDRGWTVPMVVTHHLEQRRADPGPPARRGGR